MLRIIRVVATAFIANGFAFGILGTANAAYINPATNQIEANGTGDILVSFDSSAAAFSSDVISPDYSGGFLFNNQTAAPGTTINIGSFLPGEEINFQINVLNTGFSFFTGLGSDNIDGVVHALLSADAVGNITVAFEDILNGGDFDYNDLVFSVYETPIPGAGYLLLSGLVGLGFAARTKKRVGG